MRTINLIIRTRGSSVTLFEYKSFHFINIFLKKYESTFRSKGVGNTSRIMLNSLNHNEKFRPFTVTTIKEFKYILLNLLYKRK